MHNILEADKPEKIESKTHKLSEQTIVRYVLWSKHKNVFAGEKRYLLTLENQYVFFDFRKGDTLSHIISVTMERFPVFSPISRSMVIYI